MRTSTLTGFGSRGPGARGRRRPRRRAPPAPPRPARGTWREQRRTPLNVYNRISYVVFVFIINTTPAKTSPCPIHALLPITENGGRSAPPGVGFFGGGVLGPPGGGGRRPGRAGCRRAWGRPRPAGGPRHGARQHKAGQG